MDAWLGMAWLLCYVIHFRRRGGGERVKRVKKEMTEAYLPLICGDKGGREGRVYSAGV